MPPAQGPPRTRDRPAPQSQRHPWRRSFGFAMRLLRTPIGLQVDRLTLNPGFGKGFQRLLGKLRGQLDQRVVLPDADVPEIAAMQPTLVRDRADDGTGHHLVPLADCDPIGGEVVASLSPLARPVLTRSAVGTLAALLRRRFRHEEL